MKFKLTTVAKLSAFAWLIAAPAWGADVCKQTGTPAENADLARKFYTAFNPKNKAMLDTIMTSDWLDIPLAPGQGPGREGMKAVIDRYYASFPDFVAKIEDVVAQGDKVTVRSIIRATHKGEFASLPASGKRIEIMTIDIHEICDGKIVKTWHSEDWLTGLFQMGILPLKK
jgi:steroid delta-isomerase-like uncharacterized protein